MGFNYPRKFQEGRIYVCDHSVLWSLSPLQKIILGTNSIDFSTISDQRCQYLHLSFIMNFTRIIQMMLGPVYAGFIDLVRRRQLHRNSTKVEHIRSYFYNDLNETAAVIFLLN